MASHAKRIVLPTEDRESFSFRSFFPLYTVLFIGISIFIALFFIIDRVSMIMETDGWEQHVRALAYYGRWLRAIVRNASSTGSFGLPLYGLSLGYGSDIIGTLHYYVLGDPLNLLSALVPATFTPVLYAVLIYLRLYLAGLSFAGFARYALPHAQSHSVAYAALSYVFFGFAILFSVMHPYFMNPLIYFPLILWGVERVMREQKPGLFTAAMFLSSVSSFYFLYMLVMLTVPYILWRLVTTYRSELRTLLAQGTRLLCAGILGAMMAAAVLLPAVLAFLSCSRASSGNAYELTYPLYYYRQMLAGLSNSQIGLHSWASMGLNPLVLIGLVAVFVQPGRHGIKVATIACIVAACLPFFGSMLNGFSYPSHRWYWAISLLASYALVDVWPSLKELKALQRAAMLVPVCLYAFGMWRLSQAVTWDLVGSWVAVGLTALVLLVAMAWTASASERLSGALNELLGVLAVVSIICNVFFVYSGRYGFYTEQFKTFEEAASYAKTDAAAVGAIDPMNGLYRVAGDSLDINGSALGDVSSTQYYWSVSSAAADQYYRELGNNVSLSQRVYGLDARSALEELAGVRYYVADSGWSVPAGYEEAPEFEGAEGLGGTRVYRNKYALPLGYTYAHTIDRESYDKLSMVDRQWALLQGALLEKPTSISVVEPTLTSQEIPYEVVAGEGASLAENALVAEKDGAKVTLTFKGLPNCETYLCFEGLELEPVNPENSQVYLWVRFGTDDTDMRGVTLAYRTPRHRWYEDRHNYAINSGYAIDPLTCVSITLPVAGTYRFDRLTVVGQPMTDYETYAAALGENVLKSIDMHYMGGIKATNRITGSIDLDEPRVMVITLPYTKGWTAKVDGVEQELLQANTMFFGLELESGHHEIELDYRTPGLDWGIRLSGGGALVCLVWYVARRVVDRRRKEKELAGEQDVTE